MSRDGPDPDNMPSTAWSVIRLAGIDSAEGRAALGELARDYWSPVYHYLRRHGHPPHEADDLTQSFFEQFLDGELVRTAAHDRGHFRALVRTALSRHVGKQRRHDRAQRRGGGARHIPYDFAAAELEHAAELRDDLTPEEVLHQHWALVVERRTFERLAAFYAKRSDTDRLRFEQLSAHMFERTDRGQYAELGKPLGMTRNHVGVYLHRMRIRWRQEAIAEAMRTTGTAEEGLEELRALGFGEWLEG